MMPLFVALIVFAISMLITIKNPWHWQPSSLSWLGRLALILFIGSTFVIASNNLVKAQTDPLLEITKDFGGSTALDVESGEEFTYYIAYRCASIMFDCINTTITDVLPPEVVFIEGTGPIGDITAVNYDSSSHTVTVDFVDPLGAGSTGILEITVKFPPGTLPGTTAVNQATSATTGGTFDSGQVTATATGAFEMHIDKRVANDFDDGVIGTDFITNYSLNVCNPDEFGGVNLTNVTITDTLPAEATFVNASNGGSYDSGTHTIVWTHLGNGGTLPDVIPVTSGCSLTLNVTVRFDPSGPDGTPATGDEPIAGNTAINTMDIIGTPEDGSPDFIATDPVGILLIEPYFDDGNGKNAGSPSSYIGRPIEELPGGDVNYSVSYTNEGTITATNVTVTDVLPSQVRVESIQISPVVDPANGFYETNNNPGVWLPFPGNGYAVGATVPVTTAVTATSTDIELTPGDYLTGIRWELGDVPPGTPTWSANIATFIDPGVAGNVTFANCATTFADYVEGGTPDTSTNNYCVNVTTIETRAIPRVRKTTSDDSLLPGEVTQFTLEVYNPSEAHNNVVAPLTLADLLPERLEVVVPDVTVSSGYSVPTTTQILDGDWFTFSATDGAPAPTYVFTPTFNAQNDTLLRWQWDAPYEMAPGESITINFYARVLDYTIPQSLANEGIILWDDAATTNALACDGGDGVDSYTDADDVDQDGNSGESGCFVTTPVVVEAFLAMDSQKFVDGTLDVNPGWTDYDYTVTGGAVDWRMIITNTSNVTATNIVAYDVFPHVGDTGTIDLSSRGSEWRPHLIFPITDTMGLPMTISYSQSTNPCRPEILPSGPAGCTDDWSATPPADITTVQAVRFEFCDSGGCLELPPDNGIGGGTLEFNWHMVAPNNAAVGAVAWNSFGFTAEGGGLTLLPSEPIRVGIELAANTLPGYAIGDYVWLDLVGQQDDGIQQPEETGLSGVRVELWDADTNALLDFRTTGPDGNGDSGYYEFINIPNGNYFIRFFQPQDGLFYTFSPGEQGADTAVDSNGTAPGTDPTFGDYIQTEDFTVNNADDFTIDQGMWIEADYGDAPASYPVEADSQTNPANAARHIIVPNFYLGSSVDAETDGQPTSTAWGDDQATGDDENGLTFPAYIGTAALPSGLLRINQSNTLTINATVPATTTGYLNAWIDYNADGDWDDVGEQIANNLVLTSDNANLNVTVPATAVSGTTYARFRLSSEANLSPVGTAVDGEVEDYQVQLMDLPVKSVIDSSEAHTTPHTNLAVGEIVRYRLAVPVPEGTVTNFVITDNLPDYLQFMDDNSASLSFTADNSVTSSEFTLSGGAFGSGTDPIFTLGTVTNNDSDAGMEYVLVDFNALVLNDANNQHGTTRNNNFTVTYDNNFSYITPDVTIQVVEPDVSLNKTITTTPDDAGDTIVYELVATNSSAANSETAFDLLITDTLNSHLTLQTVNVLAPGYANVTDNSNIAGNQVDISVDQLDPGDSVTVTITAVVNNNVPVGQTIPNTAYLTYSSLPGDGTSGNSTGSDTPGASGDSDGERTGSGGVNDHFASDDAPVNLDTPAIDKQISPTSYTIGDTLTYDILITLPEGVAEDLVFVDDLPVGLSYQSHQIITAFAASGGLLSNDFNGSLPAPGVTAPGGSGQNLTLNFGDTTIVADGASDNNSFLVRVTAVVLNELGNQNGDSLRNIARLRYTRNGSTTTLTDAVNISLVEPVLQINKQLVTPLPDPLDAGSDITYQIVLQHHSSTTSDAYDVVITDTLPGTLTGITVDSVAVSGIADPGYDLTGSVLRVPAAGSFDFPQGSVITVTVSATIGGTAVPGQTIANTAAATWSTLDGTPAEERDGGGDPDGNDLLDGGALDDYEVADSASLTVDGTATVKTLVGTSAGHTSGSNVTIGEVLTYSLTVIVPEGTIPSLEIVDDLPAGLAYVAGTAVVDDPNAFLPSPTITTPGGSGGDVTFTFGSFTVPDDNDPSNNSFSVALQAVVLDEPGNDGVNPGQTTLTNNATVQIGSGAPESVTPVDVIVVEPQMEIIKSFSTSEASPNDTVTVTLTVTNTGTSTTFDVIIDDPIDNSEFHTITAGSTAAGFTFSTLPSGGSTIVRYAGGSIPAGGSATFTFAMTLDSGLPPSPPDLNNVATVTQATTLDSTADDGDDSEERDEPDVSDSDDLTVIVPDIVLTKTDGITVVDPGEQITYTLTISNVGTAVATGVTITETVPANTTFAGTAGWTCLGSTCTYDLGTLANGASTTVDFSVIFAATRPPVASSVVNTAVAHDDNTHGDDPTPDNNDDTDTDAVSASIGDFVWEDVNGNGQQDDGATGIQGVGVTLYDSGNNVISTTTTLADGSYQFFELDPGDYYLIFTPPVGYTITQQNQGDGATDSDIDPATGQTATINLVAAEHDPTWDAGLYQPASIGDLVWYDLNNDGIQDGGSEIGLYNVTVNLYDGSDNFITTTTTLADGSYSFTDLPPGDYTVEVVPPTNYTSSPQNQGADDTADSDIDGAGQTTTTNLISGEDDPTWDGGLYAQPASIGDFVWLDANQNGRQEATEFGIPNVTVNLYDYDDNPRGTTTTAYDGSYSFTNLPPGDYYVEVVPPASYTITLQNQGGDDAADSDIDPGSGQTAVTTLISGENDPTWDGGLYTIPASLGDLVWLDANQDGRQDADEFGVPTVTVNLYDAGDNLLDTTTTDAYGRYSFTNLPPGDYYVEMLPPAGYTIASQDAGDDTLDSDINGSGQTIIIPLASGQNDPTWDGGLYTQPASLGDTVWLDANLNGTQDFNEGGVIAVPVSLYDGSGNLLDSTSTNASGGYSFTNLPPGDYYVQVMLPNGYAFTTQNGSGDDTTDSDVDTATGQTIVTTLVAGENDPTWDAGLVPAIASLGDFVWEDMNGDGIQDVGEPGVPNVEVRLYDISSTQIMTTTTDANGRYQFLNLTPGTYHVEFVLPGGYDFTQQDQGADDAADSDVDPTTGLTVPTNLTPGENDVSWDAGLVQPLNPALAALGNYVWEDVDGDGLQDAGEPGVANVTVNLYDSNNVLTDTTTTDANGLYQFIDLTPGDYHVEFILPAEYDFTQQDQGASDAADSDAATTTGLTIQTNLVAGENDTTWDAGLVQQLNPALAAIGNYVWLDADEDGVQDVSEPGVENVTVNLYDGLGNYVDMTTTDANGLYQFIDLTPGDYFVEFVPPNGYILTGQDQGGDDAVDSDADADIFSATFGQTIVTNLVAGENDTTWDAGLTIPSAPSTASLGDFVWLDADVDGVQDVGEAGAENVTVHLYTGAGVLVDTTTTDATGFYAFTNLLPGDYFVEFVPPTGYALTFANSGVTDLDDSDADPVSGQTAVTTLTAGENDPTWDAGLYQTLRLGNRVWFDLNDNGRLDAGEPPLPGIVMELLDGVGNPVILPATGLPLTTTTDADGIYRFENLPPGDYIVRVAESNFDDWTDPLYGFVSSRSNVSPDPAADPDVNSSDVDDNGRNNPDPANGGIVSYPVTLTVGGEPTNEGADEDGSYANADSNLTVDFGFFELLTLGNFIWLDNNENSAIDPGEPGVGGVVLYLLDGSGDPVLHPVTNQPISTITNSSGFYQFTNLYPGEYRVLVGAENFQAGGALAGYWSSPGAVDPDDNADTDDNGLDEVEPWITGIISEPVRLDYHQEPDNNDDTDDNDNTNLTVDMGFVATPTAVTLTSFTATNLGSQQVRIAWTTESEVDNFGFRLYRSSSNSFAGASQVHFEPTAVPGGSGPGASYSYIDNVPTNGTYYYWLEDVETGGATELHGPITVNVTPFFSLYLPFIIGGN